MNMKRAFWGRYISIILMVGLFCIGIVEAEEISDYDIETNTYIYDELSDIDMVQDLTNATYLMYADVTNASDLYFSSIYWLKNRSITMGYTSDNTFRPDISCTRANYCIFLWRLFGSQIVNINNPYSDVVVNNSDTYKAIMWATYNNLTVGYSDGTFRPTAYISRKEVMIILWRAEGRPAAVGTMFSDVTANPTTDTYKSILWAKQQGIVNGYLDGTFHPDDYILRRDVALVIYKYARSKGMVTSSDTSNINALKQIGDKAPDLSTGIAPNISLTAGMTIGTSSLYEISVPESAVQRTFQNYAFGYNSAGNEAIVLLGFNQTDESEGNDALVAWDITNNTCYAVLEGINIDHCNAITYNSSNNIFYVSTGTGSQKAIIGYSVSLGLISQVSYNGIASHLSMYNNDYVGSGMAYMPNNNEYVIQYVQPWTDNRMFAVYNSFSSVPIRTYTTQYRSHDYNYTGQSMYRFIKNDVEYIGFIYMTKYYYEDNNGTVRYCYNGKVDIYAYSNMTYVGTQFLPTMPGYEIESASIYDGDIYFAYGRRGKAYIYKSN